ncbi:hypothetical protein LIPSTDRAFT_5024 [Lipomyces starkeyi NRRL Y-11557]|uniref:Chromo domain-containing protein n=1 Tax=Lipomyces starkeyi NRRL Y-11557 TaxID=675824 RepID=A0A1E3Q2G8_LIPST|nr:hypothetical protein LIPSTDRAFT_5024 [Lipomyces starkeyi NRRL Y-11557]
MVGPTPHTDRLPLPEAGRPKREIYGPREGRLPRVPARHTPRDPFGLSYTPPPARERRPSTQSNPGRLATPAILVDGEEFFDVEKILAERRIHQYLVKWTGYQDPTWTAAQNMAATVALRVWESQIAHREGTSRNSTTHDLRRG